MKNLQPKFAVKTPKFPDFYRHIWEKLDRFPFFEAPCHQNLGGLSGVNLA